MNFIDKLISTNKSEEEQLKARLDMLDELTVNNQIKDKVKDNLNNRINNCKK